MRCLFVCLLLICFIVVGSSSEVDSSAEITVADDTRPDGAILITPPGNTLISDPQEPATIIGADISNIDVDKIISYVMAARLNNTASNNTSIVSIGSRV